ncbi:MAG: MFS transporter, partial [Raoultibacter sp.]
MNKVTSSSLASVLLVALAFVLGFAEFILIGIVPDVSEALNESLTLIGDIVGFYALACAVATPFVTLFAGRFRRFSVLVVLLIVFCAGNLLTLFADSYCVLLISRILAASTSGALMAIAMTFVPDIVDEKNVARVLSFVFAGFSVSSVLGVPLGALVAEAWSWKAAYAAVFALGLVVSLALWFVLPRTGGLDVPATVREQLHLLRDKRVLFASAMIVCGAASTYVFYTYLTPILESIMLLSLWEVSVVFLMFGAACVAANFLSGFLAQRWGIKGLVLVFIVQAILLALTAATVPVVSVGLANIMLVGLTMYVMNSSVQMLFLTVAKNDYPCALTFSSSMHPMSFNAGIALGSFVGGVVVNTSGLLATGPSGA